VKLNEVESISIRLQTGANCFRQQTPPGSIFQTFVTPLLVPLSLQPPLSPPRKKDSCISNYFLNIAEICLVNIRALGFITTVQSEKYSINH
jgi:hypothetical protein